MISDLFEIRPIAAEDKDNLKLGLSMLSNESKRQRFFSSRNHFSEKELKYFTEVDQKNHIAFVATYLGSDGPPHAGTIRCVRNTEKVHYAEFAVTIIDHYHGIGLGSLLLEKLAEAAKDEGITYFYGDFHSTNTKLLKLLEKYCAQHQISENELLINRKSDGFLYFEMPLS